MPRTAVRYWEKWGPSELRPLVEIVRAFNRSQSRFEVVIEQTGDWSASPDVERLRSAHAAGDVSDVVGLEDHHIADLVHDGLLQPLDAGRPIGDAERHGLHQAFEAMGVAGGDIYGAPIAANLISLYVNLEAVALPDADDARSVGSLEAFDRMTAMNQARGALGFVPTYPGWWPHAWPWLYGAHWFDSRGRFAPDQPEIVQAYEWVMSHRRHAIAAGFESPQNPIRADGNDPFLNGRVAAFFDGDWLVQRLVSAPDLRWRPMPMPSAAGAPWVIAVADLLCIPNRARCPEGAMDFIEFACRPEHLELVAAGQSKISPLQSWSTRFVTNHPNLHVAELRHMLETVTCYAEPRIPGWLAHRERIHEAVARMWVDGVPPAEALAALG